MPCMQRMPSGKRDTLGMVKPVPCGQVIPGMLQGKLGPPILCTCPVLTERRALHLVFTFYALSASPPSIGITASGWQPQRQEQGHRDGREAKIVMSHIPMDRGPWDINVAHTCGGDEPLKEGL